MQCAHGKLRIMANALSPLQTIEALNDKRAELVDKAEALQKLAEAENRSMVEEEQREFDTILDIVADTKSEIARRQRLLDEQEELKIPNGRRTAPVDAPPVEEPQAAAPATPAARARTTSPAASRITGGDYNGATRGTWGWRSFGEFGQGVAQASMRGGKIDPRLIANAPTTYGNEGSGPDGGYAVPPDFRTAITTKVQAEDSLLSRTDQQVSSSNSMTVPLDETTPWQTTGGILAYWEGEGAQMTQSKPSLKQSTVRLNKLTALVNVTEELLQDASALSAYVTRKAPEKMAFMINDAIINGNGVGKPDGILNSAALVSISEDASQTDDTVTFGNITGMWNRMYAPCRNNAVWLVNQDVEVQLQRMQFPGSGTAVPVYLPPGGLRDAPFATLLGRPVIPTEACPVLGNVGDIILADLTKYLSIMKTGGIRSEMSIHLWFDYDITAFRFIMRMGGMPWWQSSIARAASGNTNTLSCFVTVEAR